jgi:PAS domain S-box-containing protein
MEQHIVAAIFDEVEQGLCVCDGAGVIEKCNAPARQMLAGNRDTRITGRKIQEFLDLESFESPEALCRCPEGSSGSTGEIRCNLSGRADGGVAVRIRPVSAEATQRYLLLCRPAGGHCGQRPAQSDESDWRESGDRLHAIIDSLPIATFAVDNDQRVIAWNRAVEEMTGISAGRMLGQGQYVYAEPFWGKRQPVLIDLLAEEDSAFESRYEVFRRIGNTIYAEVYVPKLYQGRGAHVTLMATKLYDKAGRKIGAVECVQDITQRKEAEYQLRQSEQQLRQAQRMESIGRLAGGVAHDFNNQLTVVEGYCDLLLRQDPDPETKEALLEIRQASSRATRLTAQLLAFGRRQVLQPEVLDLVQVLRDIENPLARMIGEDIDLTLTVGPDPGHVRIDRNQFQQVVMNLAVNARDAMPTGGRLKLELANVDLSCASDLAEHPNATPGRYVMLLVEDTGLGMEPETLSRAFEPFFTTKPVGQGTGLGLSMAYGFVTQSGGFVEINSRVNEGTEIRLYLPHVQEAAQPAAPTAEIPAEPQSGSGTILVVEDEQRVEKLLTRVLKECGYHVLSARNTPDALRLAQNWNQKLDLLITDVVMPGQSGLELAHLLREEIPGLKVLFISGYAHDVLLRHGEGRIEGEILAKPFTPEQISSKVAQMLE